MTYYMNPHPALWAPLSHAWERGQGRGLDIVTVYTDMILGIICMTEFGRLRRTSDAPKKALHLKGIALKHNPCHVVRARKPRPYGQIVV